MNSTQITDLLLVIQAVITLFISLRAFSLYARTGSDMLFSLGLSMGVIASGGIIGLISDIYLNGAFNTFWFRYIGQTVSYLFIFLSTLRGSEPYRRLSGSRALVCFIIFFHYVSIFFTKETRFGFLMGFAFFCISWGLVIYSLKFTVPDPLLLDYIGDSVRIVGLTTLLAAFFLG